MKKFFPFVSIVTTAGFGLLAMFLSSCASTAQVNQFHAPSVAPVKHAVEQAEKHVSNAKSVAKKLADVTDEASKKDKAWQDAYNALTTELDNAYIQAEVAKAQIDELDKQVKQLTKDANQAVTERNAAVEHDRVTTVKYHRVKFYGTIMVGLIFLVVGGILGMRLIPPPYGYLGLCAGPIASVVFEMLL